MKGASVPVARRNILADRRRLAISVLGVGAALALMLLIEGLWGGFRVQISAYEDNVGVDLLVGEPGTRNLLGDVSVVPLDAVSTIRAIPGVDRADPVTALFTVLDLHGRQQRAFLIGSEPGGMGGPWDIASGRNVDADDELVMDRTLADEHGIGLGYRIDVMGETFEVVGLSSGTRSWMAGFVFTTQRAAGTLLRAPGTASFVLVRTDTPAAVARAIEDQVGLAALSASEMADNDRALLAGIMQGPVNLMVVIAFAAGTIIVALTVYSAVVERLREYGIAKAMGARRGRLFRIVLGQTLVLTALGTVAGFVLFRGASWLVAALRPQMWVHLGSAAGTGVLGAAALMALVAAVVPTRRVSRLDPASVYRG